MENFIFCAVLVLVDIILNQYSQIVSEKCIKIDSLPLLQLYNFNPIQLLYRTTIN